MFQDIWKVTKTLVTLADDLQKYNAELKEIRKELRDLTIIVHGLVQDNKHTKETQDLKNQLFAQEVEKRIETLVKALPPATPEKKRRRR